MDDIATWVAGIDRDVKRRPLSGAEGYAVVLRRTYDDVSVENLWAACTEPARLQVWFLPVSGDLRAGGRFQFEGNAAGDILECQELRLVRVTWVYGDSPTHEVGLRLSPSGEAGAALELEHAAPVEGDTVPELVLGVGPGWDQALAALGLYFRGELPEDKAAWPELPEVKQLIAASISAWSRVLNKRGVASPEVVARAAAASLAFYTGGEPASQT
jgi:uncharacterized protein YndB with AHSA1/START domain